MTQASSTPRIATLGLLCLAVTSIGWGLNWPAMKHLLTEWPPLSARGLSGVIGGLMLAGIARMRGESLYVPPGQRAWLVLLALLNVAGWMALMGLALLWLPASEAAVIAYTMPVWAALLAWLILGEQMSVRRIIAMFLAFGGIVMLMGGAGFKDSAEKWPGIAMVLIGSVGFALGTVLAKLRPLTLPLFTNSAWQIGIGCLPVGLIGLVVEHPSFSSLSWVGWSVMAYMIFVQFCVAYVCWFAALKLLPASVAAIGTMAVPVIGVLGSAALLHEPLGLAQVAALACTLGGVALATRA